MAIERIQWQIDLLLEQREVEGSKLNRAEFRDRARAVLAYDPDSQDAHALLAAMEVQVGPGRNGAVGGRFGTLPRFLA